VHFPVVAGTAAGKLVEELVEAGRGLEAGGKGTVRYGQLVICQQVYRVLNADACEVGGKGGLRVFVEEL